MATSFPKAFLEFLKLLNAHEVEYLVIGGYAVGYHGYPRATGDIDVWIARSPGTAHKMVQVFNEFGFREGVTPDLFLRERGIIRIGVPPTRLEVTTYIDGVNFADCYARRRVAYIEGHPIAFLGLEDLRANKRASGRHKDLADLENLPEH
ncbi:MAG: hypothetical protein AB7S38_37335 [Vulcanimicrobiota bacterium]